MNSTTRTGLPLLALFVLSACGGGGGGGGGGGSSNTAPVSNAGANQVVDEQTSVTLDGTGSSDADGNALNYTWSQVGGPGVTLANANTAQASFTAPNVGIGSTERLTFRLRVSDGAAVDDDDISIDVNGVSNSDPVANAGADQAVGEGSTVNLSGSASDADLGDTLTYTWVETTGTGITINDASTANASFTAPQVGASGEVFTFQLTVSDGRASASDQVNVTVNDGAAVVEISGVVQYEFVPPTIGCFDLNFGAVQTRPIRGATVQLLDAASGNPVASTTAGDTGAYAFPGMMPNANYRIRVIAELTDAGASPNWEVYVRDNTDVAGGTLPNRAVYALDGSNFDSGNDATMVRPPLVATTGWSGTYTGPRNAAPFAVLDAAYSAVRLILSGDSTADFPRLDMFWSVNNRPVGTNDYDIGELTTAHYTSDPDRNGIPNPSLFLRGDIATNQDDFDAHVAVHEWGHYFEAIFSRSNSPGGGHALGETIDARLAWGEGWAHALAGIALDEPQFCDTAQVGAGRGFGWDAENDVFGVSGWHNELSVMAFVYDLWDTTNEPGDGGSIGWGPMYRAMVGGQRSSGAFTTLFSFASVLLNDPSLNQAERDFINAQLNRINTETTGLDEWGSAETQATNPQIPGTRDVFPLYQQITPNGSISTVCTNSDFDRPRPDNHGNKLGSFQYLTFDVAQAGNYQVRVETVGTGDSGTDTPRQPPPGFSCFPGPGESLDDPQFHTYSDPDWWLFRGPSSVWQGWGCTANQEVATIFLQAGEHVMDLRDYRHADQDTVDTPTAYPDRVCYEVSVTPQ